MIRMYDEFFWPQIMLPNLKNMNKSIQFFIINRIIQLCTIQLFRKICNRPTLLHQNTANTKSTSITCNFKLFREIRKCESRCINQPMFQFIKSILLGCAPLKLNTFHCKLIQRCSNSTKIFHKTPIEISKTMKASYNI